jgi:hypothetical protein
MGSVDAWTRFSLATSFSMVRPCWMEMTERNDGDKKSITRAMPTTEAIKGLAALSSERSQ